MSGNGWYLTRLINQSGVKRLEARIARGRDGEVERERDEGDIRPVLCVKQGPLAALSFCLAPSRTPTDTLAAVSVTLGHSTTECRMRMQQ